jgi:hypothetical protein
MSRCLVVAAVAAVACATAAAPSAPAAARSKCAAKGSRTITATRDARAFRRAGRSYACLYRVGRRFRLGDEPAEPDFFRAFSVRLAGRYVAYELAFVGREETHFDVRVRNLRSGRWVHRLPANSAPETSPISTSSPGVTDLALARNGAVAWITRDPYVNPATLEVHKADADGHAQLDTGAGIDPGSLALSGKTIYWLSNGTPRTATLR